MVFDLDPGGLVAGHYSNFISDFSRGRDIMLAGQSLSTRRMEDVIREGESQCCVSKSSMKMRSR